MAPDSWNRPIERGMARVLSGRGALDVNPGLGFLALEKNNKTSLHSRGIFGTLKTS